MLPMYLVLAALLLAPASLLAQEETSPREATVQSASPPAVRQAAPRGTRAQGDNPRVGTAVPRRGAPRADGDRDGNRGESRGRFGGVPNRGRTVIVRPPSVYNYYYPSPYYYPRRYYPYGYGSFGLGYFYYDRYPFYQGGYYPYGSTYYARPFSAFDAGELRLNVSPRHAHVYVDGYYAGTVDDFDGAFQSLKLESGPYRIEIVAPGYETLTFDVRINPGQKTTYRGDLARLRP